jgi:hypothetical protein
LLRFQAIRDLEIKLPSDDLKLEKNTVKWRGRNLGKRRRQEREIERKKVETRERD